VFSGSQSHRATLRRFLGERYRDADLIWILGGDQNVESDGERRVLDELAAGLRKGDAGGRLITFHPRGPGLSSLRLHDAPGSTLTWSSPPTAPSTTTPACSWSTTTR